MGPFIRAVVRALLHPPAAVVALAAPAALATLPALAGCTPHIGDKCVLSTDCSVQGTLVCDTSQPNGYCTQLNCVHQSCPANSLCAMFQSSVPGCAYDDYQAPSRTGRSFCMENCNQDSDCRQSDGYVCADPKDAPWNGAILDDNQSQRVCIVAASRVDAGSVAQVDAAICQPYQAGADAEADAAPGPAVDAAVDATTEADGGGIESGADAAGDATTDVDASTDGPGGG
jgi:hypothetical protein